jgi:hypothetical protein
MMADRLTWDRLAAAVEAARGEHAEVMAVVDALAAVGCQRRFYWVEDRLPDGRRAYVYVWKDTPAGTLGLLAGPDVKGRLFHLQATRLTSPPRGADLYVPYSEGRTAYVSMGRRALAQGAEVEAAPLGVPLRPSRKRANPHDGDAYFSDEAMDDAVSATGGASRHILVHMAPAAFLSLAEAGTDPGKAKTVADLLASGTRFRSVPHLSIDTDRGGPVARVFGHEGRHRARALQALGVRSMPVLITASSHRWRDDPDHPRYIKPQSGWGDLVAMPPWGER